VTEDLTQVDLLIPGALPTWIRGREISNDSQGGFGGLVALYTARTFCLCKHCVQRPQGVIPFVLQSP
jgi:hypothetical protein